MQLRFIAWLTALIFFFTSSGWADPVPQYRPVPEASPALAPFTKIHLPENLGTIEEEYQADHQSPKVILIQDAHAVPSAQRNIQKLIEYFQKQYGIRLAALEGASGPLDTQIFQSFPDKNLLREVLNDYSEKGELAGGPAAAVFNPSPQPSPLGRGQGEGTTFYGIENWSLYEKGIRLYQEAISQEPSLSKALSAERIALGQEKGRIYSKKLLEIDQALEAFYENHTELMKILSVLAKVKAPRPESELALLLKESQGKKNPVGWSEIEINLIAKKVEAILKQRVNQQALTAEFNSKLQAVRTSQITSEAFSLYLKELIQRNRLPIRFPKNLTEAAIEQKKLENIQGTHLFKDFENYVEEVKTALIQSEEEKNLDERAQELRLLERFAKLELSDEEWEKIKTRDNRPQTIDKNKSNELSLWSSVYGQLSPHFAFYETASARDDAFYRNLISSMMQQKTDRAVMVAGGFHARRMARLFKENGISYSIVLPKIDSIPDQTSYQAQMRGEVSWKDYFEVKNGKINLYEAFVRAVRDRLVHQYTRVPGTSPISGALVTGAPLVRLWRDQIIRDLAAQGKIEASHQYTRFLDEVVPLRLRAPQGQSNDLIKRADQFIAGLRRLHASGNLTQQSILQLLQSSKTTSVFSVLPFQKDFPVSSTLFSITSRSEMRTGVATLGEHLRLHEEGDFSRVLEEIAQQHKIPVRSAFEWGRSGNHAIYDFRKAIKEHGQQKGDTWEWNLVDAKGNPTFMRLEKDGILVIQDSRLKKGHAGRNELAVYAPNPVKAAYNLAVLRYMRDYALRKQIVKQEDIVNGSFGDKLEVWVNEERKFDKNLMVPPQIEFMVATAHQKGLEAEFQVLFGAILDRKAKKLTNLTPEVVKKMAALIRDLDRGGYAERIGAGPGTTSFYRIVSAAGFGIIVALDLEQKIKDQKFLLLALNNENETFKRSEQDATYRIVSTAPVQSELEKLRNHLLRHQHWIKGASLDYKGCLLFTFPGPLLPRENLLGMYKANHLLRYLFNRISIATHLATPADLLHVTPKTDVEIGGRAPEGFIVIERAILLASLERRQDISDTIVHETVHQFLKTYLGQGLQLVRYRPVFKELREEIRKSKIYKDKSEEDIDLEMVTFTMAALSLGKRAVRADFELGSRGESVPITTEMIRALVDIGLLEKATNVEDAKAEIDDPIDLVITEEDAYTDAFAYKILKPAPSTVEKIPGAEEVGAEDVRSEMRGDTEGAEAVPVDPRQNAVQIIARLQALVSQRPSSLQSIPADFYDLRDFEQALRSGLSWAQAMAGYDAGLVVLAFFNRIGQMVAVVDQALRSWPQAEHDMAQRDRAIQTARELEDHVSAFLGALESYVQDDRRRSTFLFQHAPVLRDQLNQVRPLTVELHRTLQGLSARSESRSRMDSDFFLPSLKMESSSFQSSEGLLKAVQEIQSTKTFAASFENGIYHLRVFEDGIQTDPDFYLAPSLEEVGRDAGVLLQHFFPRTLQTNFDDFIEAASLLFVGSAGITEALYFANRYPSIERLVVSEMYSESAMKAVSAFVRLPEELKKKVMIVREDFLKTHFRDGVFDMIYSNNSWVREILRARLDEAWQRSFRLLKEKGIFLGSADFDDETLFSSLFELKYSSGLFKVQIAQKKVSRSEMRTSIDSRLGIQVKDDLFIAPTLFLNGLELAAAAHQGAEGDNTLAGQWMDSLSEKKLRRFSHLGAMGIVLSAAITHDPPKNAAFARLVIGAMRKLAAGHLEGQRNLTLGEFLNSGHDELFKEIQKLLKIVGGSHTVWIPFFKRSSPNSSAKELEQSVREDLATMLAHERFQLKLENDGRYKVLRDKSQGSMYQRTWEAIREKHDQINDKADEAFMLRKFYKLLDEAYPYMPATELWAQLYYYSDSLNYSGFDERGQSIPLNKIFGTLLRKFVKNIGTQVDWDLLETANQEIIPQWEADLEAISNQGLIPQFISNSTNPKAAGNQLPDQSRSEMRSAETQELIRKFEKINFYLGYLWEAASRDRFANDAKQQERIWMEDFGHIRTFMDEVTKGEASKYLKRWYPIPGNKHWEEWKRFLFYENLFEAFKLADAHDVAMELLSEGVTVDSVPWPKVLAERGIQPHSAQSELFVQLVTKKLKEVGEEADSMAAELIDRGAKPSDIQALISLFQDGKSSKELSKEKPELMRLLHLHGFFLNTINSPAFAKTFFTLIAQRMETQLRSRSELRNQKPQREADLEAISKASNPKAAGNQLPDQFRSEIRQLAHETAVEFLGYVQNRLADTEQRYFTKAVLAGVSMDVEQFLEVFRSEVRQLAAQMTERAEGLEQANLKQLSEAIERAMKEIAAAVIKKHKDGGGIAALSLRPEDIAEARLHADALRELNPNFDSIHLLGIQGRDADEIRKGIAFSARTVQAHGNLDRTSVTTQAFVPVLFPKLAEPFDSKVTALNLGIDNFQDFTGSENEKLLKRKFAIFLLWALAPAAISAQKEGRLNVGQIRALNKMLKTKSFDKNSQVLTSVQAALIQDLGPVLFSRGIHLNNFFNDGLNLSVQVIEGIIQSYRSEQRIQAAA